MRTSFNLVEMNEKLRFLHVLYLVPTLVEHEHKEGTFKFQIKLTTCLWYFRNKQIWWKKAMEDMIDAGEALLVIAITAGCFCVFFLIMVCFLGPHCFLNRCLPFAPRYDECDEYEGLPAAREYNNRVSSFSKFSFRMLCFKDIVAINFLSVRWFTEFRWHSVGPSSPVNSTRLSSLVGWVDLAGNLFFDCTELKWHPYKEPLHFKSFKLCIFYTMWNVHW